MREITFTTIGLPAPQGSKNKWGGEDNKRVKPYREAVASDASLKMDGWDLLYCPVAVYVTFFFPRPKSHYRTGKNAHLLREDAPTHMKTKPDLDKLLRAIGDALTGVVLRDDSQIVCFSAMKRYADGGPVRTELLVREIAP